MTQDSAAVATLDDRRPRPISAASNVAEDASSLMANSIITCGSSSNGDIGGGDEGASPKSSSIVSTTTSCCGSTSSRSGSDDDDSMAVPQLPTMVEDSCPLNVNTPPLPSLHNDVIGDNNGDKDSSSNFNDAVDSTTSTNIGGRLTFYKGNCIFGNIFITLKTFLTFFCLFQNFFSLGSFQIKKIVIEGHIFVLNKNHSDFINT